jgi:hypothetical protein
MNYLFILFLHPEESLRSVNFSSFGIGFFWNLKIKNYVFISVLYGMCNCAIAVNLQVQIEVTWF